MSNKKILKNKDIIKMWNNKEKKKERKKIMSNSKRILKVIINLRNSFKKYKKNKKIKSRKIPL